MNGRFLKKDLARAFQHMGFLIATSLLVIIFVHAICANVNFDEEVSTYEIISAAMALSGFTPFAAVFASIGYAVTFCEEYRSGYLKMITSRISWKAYGAVRMIAVGLSGGLTFAIPFAVVCLIGYLFGVHGMPDNGLYAGTQMQFYLEQYGDYYLLVGKILLGFLFGILWSLVSLAFAVWSGNRYVALIAPFVLYETMWILLSDVRLWNPIYLIRGDDLGSYSLSAAVEIVYILLTVIVIWLGFWRRAHYERASEIYKICVYELKKQSKSIRVLLGYLVGAVLIINQSGAFLHYAEGKEAINVLETFIVAGNDYKTAMYLVLGWLLIISESPLSGKNSLYIIYRTNRKSWNLAMILSVIVQAICYYGTMAFITVVLGIGNGYFSKEWSAPLVKLTQSASAGRKYQLTFPYRTFVGEVTVFEGFLHTLLLYLLYGIILGLFLYTVTLVSNQVVGAIAAFSLHFLGYETLAEGFMIVIKYSLLARTIPVLQIGADLGVKLSHSYLLFLMLVVLCVSVSSKVIAYLDLTDRTTRGEE